MLLQLLPEDMSRRLSECQPDPSLNSTEAGYESVLIRCGKTGKTLTQPEFPNVRRLNIQKTRTIWAQGLNVKFGKRISDIKTTSDGVTAHFEDGTSETGSVLIGADGGSSWVRRWMLGDAGEPEVLPYTFLNFSVHYTREQALKMGKMIHPIVDVASHPKSMYAGIFLLDKPDMEKPETWPFYLLATWPRQEEDYECGKDMIPELKKRMDNWSDPYKSAVEWIPEGTHAKALDLKIWGPPKSGWDNRNGKTTLSGDAAHSMTFRKSPRPYIHLRRLTLIVIDRGQGANNAVADSSKFVTAMTKVKEGAMSLKEAVNEYDADVISRGRNEVDTSKIQTGAFHDYERFLDSPLLKHGIKPLNGKAG
jgi:hypothetical protein